MFSRRDDAEALIAKRKEELLLLEAMLRFEQDNTASWCEKIPLSEIISMQEQRIRDINKQVLEAEPLIETLYALETELKTVESLIEDSKIECVEKWNLEKQQLALYNKIRLTHELIDWILRK